MKKINNAAKQNTSKKRSFRRFVREMFDSLLKHQTRDYQADFQKVVLEKLQAMEDSIEIIAREMARQAERGK